MTTFSEHISPRTKRLFITGIISDKFVDDLNRCLINPTCNNFTELNFRKTNLSHVQAETLFHALRNNTSLDRLDLTSNPIDSSLKALTNILPSTNIKELVLSDTRITDKDLTDEFFTAISKSNVKYLDLSYNHFGEEVATCMIRELFNSTTIDLRGNKGMTPDIALKLGDIIHNACKNSDENCSLRKTIWQSELYKNYHTGYIDASFWTDSDTTTQNTLPYHKSNTSNSIDTDNCSLQNNDSAYLSWIIPITAALAGCVIGICGKITYDHFDH